MSILNKSIITPNGRPVFPSKGSGFQDAAAVSQQQQQQQQHLRVALPLHGIPHPLKSFQLISPSSSSKRGSLAIASEGCPQLQGSESSFGREPSSALDIKNKWKNGMPHQEPIIDVINFKTVTSDMELEPCTNSSRRFLHSLLENERINNILTKEDHVVVGESDQQQQLFSSDPNATMVVSVSSAVKLERKQIDLIARKMQRLTGFRNLRMENTIDPSLIAGFVICCDKDGSHAIDLSVKGQLAQLAARVESSEQRIANNEQDWSFPNIKS